jgi:hypothetical protein
VPTSLGSLLPLDSYLAADPVAKSSSVSELAADTEHANPEIYGVKDRTSACGGWSRSFA